ncbi:MAG TPA: polysaccharide deacetylase family protein [Candidatus Acidoferrales bacterium]
MNLLPLAVPAALAGIAAWGAAVPSSQLFGRTVVHRRSAKGEDCLEVALTFDDGPNPRCTPALLDLLDRHEAKATFFLVGRFVRQHPELAREVAARGHALGNHTQTHPNLFWKGTGRIARELEECHRAIEEVCAVRPRLFRPPFGFRGPHLFPIVRRAGMEVIMWSVMPRDWKMQPAEQIAERLKKTRSGDIVLLHDGDHRRTNGDRMHTVNALALALPCFAERGWRCVTVSELGKKAGARV